MESNLAKNILRVCEVFNKHDVKCMIVGGTAVALHGYFRHSMNFSGEVVSKPDIDFWYNPSYENYFNLIKALEELGRDVQAFKDEKMPNPKKSFFRFDSDDYTLDLLPEIKAPIKFQDAYKRREVVRLNSIEISFITLKDLLEDKEAAARPKDLNDIEHLKNANEDEKLG
ncbi:MAG: hypothetical protein IT258_13865 [Saprospiraceae bacterium]|nr:hypothetical protein [Saprospiraceae bacterium]